MTSLKNKKKKLEVQLIIFWEKWNRYIQKLSIFGERERLVYKQSDPKSNASSTKRRERERVRERKRES